VSANACLAEAEELLSGRRSLACWPIATAVLLRAALEAGIDSHLAAILPDTTRCSMRARLLVLTVAATTDRATAVEAATTWATLSRAVHHHVYELPPTLAELRSWQASVVRFVAAAH